MVHNVGQLEEVEIDLVRRNNNFKVINKKLDQISLKMEKSKLADYVYYMEHPRKMLWSNFLGGLARGFGAAIGFTVLGALVIYVLQWIVRWNLPFIGEYISEIVDIVENNLHKNGR